VSATVNPSNPGLRFFAGIGAAAIAIRIAVELIRPVFSAVVRERRIEDRIVRVAVV
jgi:hypothetical protein